MLYCRCCLCKSGCNKHSHPMMVMMIMMLTPTMASQLWIIENIFDSYNIFRLKSLMQWIYYVLVSGMYKLNFHRFGFLVSWIHYLRLLSNNKRLSSHRILISIWMCRYLDFPFDFFTRYFVQSNNLTIRHKDFGLGIWIFRNLMFYGKIFRGIFITQSGVLSVRIE